MPLGERVAGDACLDGERDDGERAVRPLGSAYQDAVHRGTDLVVLFGRWRGQLVSFPVPIRVQSCLPAWSRSLAAVPTGGGLGDVRGLGFQCERASAELGGLLVGAGCLGSTLVHLGRVAD